MARVAFIRRPKTWILLGLGLVFLVVVGVAVGNAYFFPERATQVDEAAPKGATELKRGTFEGAGDGVHHVSGTIRVLRTESGHLLRFENYAQTQGPDVFVYLTTMERPEARTDVESGLRVLIDGGADEGESTKEGNFQQALPADFDPATYHALAIWCDRFNVLFGRAALDST